MDDKGRALLAEQERELAEADAFGDDWVRRFRSSLPPVPELKLPEDDSAVTRPAGLDRPERDDDFTPVGSDDKDSIRENGISWWRKPASVSNGLVSAAAVLLVGFMTLFFLAYRGYLNSPGTTISDKDIPRRIRHYTDPAGELGPLNDALYEDLLQRGIYFMKRGEKEDNNREILMEALYDLLRARDLKETPRVLQFLALTYEALGDNRKAKEILEKKKALEEKD